ncbi:hypothetical protein PMZ80_004725 [Knufia obscura]|uniref:Uncharacterized protein n=1 Tax=Knufia obscura TaxID=1635080 RepID=A0ABR0RTI2_9EURO|nr:hypothetical protein PMZ80_004725 [Knufia obscura]
MQSSTGVPKGALYILSGVAAVAACYLSYQRFFQNQTTKVPTEASLHRSNAVRRRRRRWRDGYRPLDLDHDPTSLALEHLKQREDAGEGYGMYHNQYYVNEQLMSSHGQSFVLLPSRLEHIYTTITQGQVPALSQAVCEQLSMHIQARFVQTFLHEEYPEGYLVSPDLAELRAALAPTIEPDLLHGALQIHDQGEDIVDADLQFPEELRATANRQREDPAGIAQALAGGNGRRISGDEEQEEDHTVLDLLYRIGEEQAKRNGYQHRGVECNGCGMQPIRGIRYHCANCWDYDLCESCEAQQIHHKTHVFYKIRIPAPTRGQIKLVQPKWYPGNPNACPESIPSRLREFLLATTNLERQDLDALYDQFKCIAGGNFKEDPDNINMAIDRPSFDRYFTSTSADRPPTPNLIFDRIFAFYDHNSDGMITFHEFAHGMAELAHNTSREARIRRLFKAFDLDGDGYVDRRDFLYLLRAHYNLNKELAHEMIYARDDVLSEEEVREVIHGNHPISAVFGGSVFPGHGSRQGQGKHGDINGDLVLDSELGEIIQADSRMLGDRAEAIARQASEARPIVRPPRDTADQQPRDEPVVGGSNPRDIVALDSSSSARLERAIAEARNGLLHNPDAWPNVHISEEDVVQALGARINLEDIADPQDRQCVLAAQQERLWKELEASNRNTEQAAIHDRWQRRDFYIDEEEGFTKPAGYQESDSSDAEDASHANGGTKSFRSRSSSKVRFDETAIDNDIETKSDVSSRNTPINERWGGYEFTQPNRDVGVEIIYEAVQQAFNSMIAHFFKDQEDQAMAAKASRNIRKQHIAEIQEYKERLAREDQRKEQALIAADMERTEALLNASSLQANELHAANTTQDQELQRSVTKARTPDAPEEHRDATLPQYRPNDKSIQPSLPGKTEIVVDDSVLAKWLQHEKVEQHAKERGGFAKLNLQEFKRKLRDESDIDIGAEGHDEEHFWEEKADLGRFSFLSSWIEMASF